MPQRVLIVGSGSFDSVGDSYRRTLAPFYDVTLVDPVRTLDPVVGRGRVGALLSAGAGLLSRVALHDAMAWTFPALLRAARETAPDFVLVSYVDLLPPRVVRDLRASNRGAKVLGVFSDSLANLGHGYCFDSDYDALFFKDRYMVDTFRAKLGWKHAFYLPQACDPELHHPVELTEADRRRYGCDVTIAGNVYYYRAAALAPLVGRDLKIWGGPMPRWMDHPIRQHHQHHHVTGLEKCKAMTGARIVLNNNHYSEIAGTNKRTFEVAAIGAFQLTDTPALADVFAVDEEVAAYRTRAEMLEKIDHYLRHPEVRADMGRRASVRALREHTYAHRWAAKLGALGMDAAPGFPSRPADVVVGAR